MVTLAQLGQPGELKLGKEILSELKAPVRMMVGEHDWFFDMGEKWQELFGKPTYSFDHKGAHFHHAPECPRKGFLDGAQNDPDGAHADGSGPR